MVKVYLADLAEDWVTCLGLVFGSKQLKPFVLASNLISSKLYFHCNWDFEFFEFFHHNYTSSPVEGRQWSKKVKVKIEIGCENYHDKNLKFNIIKSWVGDLNTCTT